MDQPMLPARKVTNMEQVPRPYGVLGRVLGHSYTPTIYRELAGLDYRKFERDPEDLEAFVRSDEWEGFNVTIPYKRDLVPYMDELSEVARRMGNINTVTRLADGRLRGDNTDYYGCKVLVESLGIDLAGKKAVVFGGSGGAGSTAMMVLADLGMRPVSIDRSGENTYENLKRHADAALALNCTPVGMFPACPAAPCSLESLPALEGLIDIVYNPARTALMMEAERREVPNAGGLLMLVAQAAQAVERYTGERIDMARIMDVTARLSASEQNVALIGMPGCGKTRVGEQLAKLLDRTHVDIDRAFGEEAGMSCAEFIETQGEDAVCARRRCSDALPRNQDWSSRAAAAWSRVRRTTPCCIRTASSSCWIGPSTNFPRKDAPSPRAMASRRSPSAGCPSTAHGRTSWCSRANAPQAPPRSCAMRCRPCCNASASPSETAAMCIVSHTASRSPDSRRTQLQPKRLRHAACNSSAIAAGTPHTPPTQALPSLRTQLQSKHCHHATRTSSRCGTIGCAWHEWADEHAT